MWHNKGKNNNKNEDLHLLLNKNLVFLYPDASFLVVFIPGDPSYFLNNPQPLPSGFPDFLR